MVFASPLPDITLPDTPLTDYVLERAPELGGKAALIDGATGRVVTYRDLNERVRAFAGGLTSRGMTKGQCIAIMAPNMPEYAVIFHGAALAGCVITTVNPTYTAEEVRRQLTDAGARLLFVAPGFLQVAQDAARDTSVETIYVIGDADGAAPFTELLGPPLTEPVPLMSDDMVCLPYSSGTTGLSKGVMLSHGNLTSNIAQFVATAQLAEDETFIAVLPFFHIYGMQVLMNAGLRVGATIVTMPRFDLEQFLALHQEYRATRAFVAPPIVVALAKHPMVDQFDLSALRQVISGAAPLSAELALEAGSRIGCEIVQGFGMTELSPVSHLAPPGQSKPGSVGVSLPGTLTKIVDPSTNVELDEGQDGELCIRGPQVMLGYLNNQAATDAMIEPDGWLHTGDIGHVDSDGHLFIVDRLKELIKYNGFQVPPAELEALLLTHPSISDAAVVGVPDDVAGEIPVAHVVLRPGATASAVEIQEFVAARVAHYKQVREVVITDSIPKSPSGKILRRLLRDQT